MSIAAEDGRDVVAPVGEAARVPVLGALDVLSAMAHEELAAFAHDHAVPDRVSLRLAEIDALHQQLRATTGPVRLTGPEWLVASVVRAAASQATYELDALVEKLAGQPGPLSEDDVINLRRQIVAAAGAVGTFVACESGRIAD